MTGNVVRGRCESGHAFTVADLPMDLIEFANRAKKAKCPTCGSTKIYVATGSDSASEPGRADGGASIVMKHTNIAGSQP